MIFATVKNITVPQGKVNRILSNGVTLWKKSRLPSAYQEVEYIEATGTQYLDTGVFINYARDKAQQTATAQYTTSNTSRELMGANGYGFWGKAANNILEAAVGSSAGITESALSQNTVTLITDPSDNNSVVFEVNSKRYQSRASSFADNNYACYIFAIGGRDGAAASFFCKARVYDYMIRLNGEVASHLIPCRRKVDGELGMYDLVGKRFLTNAGTGKFTSGAEV